MKDNKHTLSPTARCATTNTGNKSKRNNNHHLRSSLWRCSSNNRNHCNKRKANIKSHIRNSKSKVSSNKNSNNHNLKSSNDMNLTWR